MKRYYLIMGLDNGEKIAPYIIDDKTNDIDCHLSCYGDMVRHYEPFKTEKEAQARLLEVLKESDQAKWKIKNGAC